MLGLHDWQILDRQPIWKIRQKVERVYFNRDPKPAEIGEEKRLVKKVCMRDKCGKIINEIDDYAEVFISYENEEDRRKKKANECLYKNHKNQH